MGKRVQFGFQGKLMINTGSSYETPTWVEIKNARAVKVTATKQEVDVTTRAGGGFKIMDVSLHDLAIDFEQINQRNVSGSTVTADDDIKKFRDAFIANSDVDIWAVDGDTTGNTTNEGPRFIGRVVKRDLDQSNDKEQVFSITIKPTVSDHPPVFLASAAS